MVSIDRIARTKAQGQTESFRLSGSEIVIPVLTLLWWLLFIAPSFGVTGAPLEFGLWGCPKNAEIIRHLHDVYPGGIGGIKQISVIQEDNVSSAASGLRTRFRDVSTVAGISFLSTFGYDGGDVGSMWKESDPRRGSGQGTMYFNGHLVNELYYTSGAPSCTEGEEPVCTYTVTWSSEKGAPEINPASPGFSGTWFKNQVEDGFNRHKTISDQIYLLQKDFGLAPNISGIQIGGDQQGTALNNWASSRRFHSLVRAVRKMIQVYNANRGDKDRLVNVGDAGKEFVVSVPPLINTSSDLRVQSSIRAAIDGASLSEALLPRANVLSVYANVYMRYYEDVTNPANNRNPWVRLDRQVAAANQVLFKPGVKLRSNIQAHLPEWYEAILHRMPQSRYHCDADGCYDAMSPSRKVTAMMAPDAHFTINQFYYALATGTSQMVFYIPTSEGNTSIDPYEDIDMVEEGARQYLYIKPVTAQYSHRERELGFISLMWEAQNLKNMPKFIANRNQYPSDTDFWNDPPLRFINGPSQTDYRSIRIRKVVTGADTPCYTSGGTMSFSASRRTITDPNGNFIERGFVPETKISISGSTSNNVKATITEASSTQITVRELLANEGPGGADRIRLRPTYHDAIFVFHWDQSDAKRKSYVFVEPSVSRKSVTLREVIDTDTYDLDTRYEAMYRWSPTGLIPVRKVAEPAGAKPSFRNSTIEVSEHRPVILIGTLRRNGTSHDNGTDWDLESLYCPFHSSEYRSGWRDAMVAWLGNTQEIGTLRHELASADGWTEPLGCTRVTGQDGDGDSLYYYTNPQLVDGADSCPDAALFDDQEAAEAIRYIHWIRRLFWVTRAPEKAAYVPLDPSSGPQWSTARVSMDNGCSDQSRDMGAFLLLYKGNGDVEQRWNYFFRFDPFALPTASYRRITPSKYPWLDKYNRWEPCQ